MRTLLRDLGTVSGVQCACIVRGGEVLASSFPEKEAVAQAASLGFVRGIADGLEGAGREFEEVIVDFAGRSLLVAPVTKDFVLAMLAAPDANAQLLRVVMGSSVRQLRRMNDIPEKPEPAAARPAPAAAAARPAPGSPPPRPQTGPSPAQGAPQGGPQGAPQGGPAPTGRPPAATGRPQPPSRPAPPPPPIKGQQPAKPQPAPPQAAAKAQTPDKPAPAAPKAADKDAEPILPQVLALLTEYIGPVARVSFKRGVTKWREKGSPTVGTLGELAKILAADLSTDSEKKAFLDAVERLRGN